MDQEIDAILQAELGRLGALGGAVGGMGGGGVAGAAGGAMGGKLGAKWAAGKLKTEVYSETLPLTNKTVEDIKQQLRDYLQDTGSGTLFKGVVGSGIGNMNPAYVVATVDDSAPTLYVAAYAKEGLIKQHTAEKAVTSLLAKLQ